MWRDLRQRVAILVDHNDDGSATYTTIQRLYRRNRRMHPWLTVVSITVWNQLEVQKLEVRSGSKLVVLLCRADRSDISVSASHWQCYWVLISCASRGKLWEIQTHFNAAPTVGPAVNRSLNSSLTPLVMCPWLMFTVSILQNVLTSKSDGVMQMQRKKASRTLLNSKPIVWNAPPALHYAMPHSQPAALCGGFGHYWVCLAVPDTLDYLLQVMYVCILGHHNEDSRLVSYVLNLCHRILWYDTRWHIKLWIFKVQRDRCNGSSENKKISH